MEEAIRWHSCAWLRNVSERFMVECPVRKTDLKSQSRSTYLVPRLHRLLVIAESTDGLLGNLFELEDLGATAGARRSV
jgi:hypothetical protein